MNPLVKKISLLAFVISAPLFAAPVDKLQDSFGGTSVNTTLWTVTTSHGTVTESGGTLNLTPNANTGLASLLAKSTSTYSFTGSQAAVKASRVPSSAGNVNAQFSGFLDGRNYVHWCV